MQCRNHNQEVMFYSGWEVWRPASGRVELWCDSLRSACGEDAFIFSQFSLSPLWRVMIKALLGILWWLHTLCLWITHEQMYKHAPIASHILPLPVNAPTGCAPFRPRQPATAAGEGEEWSIPHASLHPAWLPVSTPRHDWGGFGKEAYGEISFHLFACANESFLCC